MIILIISLVILCCLYWSWKQRQRSKLKLPPGYPDQWPIIGAAHDLLGKIKNSKDLMQLVSKYAEACNKHDGVIHAYMGPILIFVVTDPDDIVTILTTCLEKNWAYEFCKSWVGDGLVTVTSNLGIWKRHRKVIRRAFNQQVLDGYVSIFNKQAKWLIRELTAHVDTEPFNHSGVLEDLALGIMYQTTMGLKENEVDIEADQENKRATRAMLNIIAKRFQNIWLLSKYIYNFTAMKKEEDQLVSILHRTTYQVINKKRLALQDTKMTPTKFKSFLDLLLELPPEDAFTDKEIQEEVETMIVAGSDTTATMLTYCLMLLGTYQNIQDKVYQELIEVLGDSHRDVEKQDVSKLVFTEAVLQESMRLYPILPVLMRYIAQDVKLRNYTLPAGTTAFMLVYSMHRDPAVWGPDAAEFRPQRWLPAPPPAARAYASFSIGKRGCIGKTYAMMSMKIVLAHFLRHYRVTADITKLEVQLDSFLKPASGCEISLQRRK